MCDKLGTDMTEKRSQTRFKVDDEIYVYNSSSYAAFVGNILDISHSGISFSYVMDISAPVDLDKLSILSSKHRYVLKNLPFETISDEIIQGDPASTVVMRRRSGRFLSLTPEQERELERFIENFTQ